VDLLPWWTMVDRLRRLTRPASWDFFIRGITEGHIVRTNKV
jgi:hypothetical protein